MKDPIMSRLYELGFEPMDIDKDLTVSDCCNMYKNRLDYDMLIGNHIYEKPNCDIIKELVILTVKGKRRIFKTQKTTGYTKYLVIKGQELLGVYEQYKTENKQKMFHDCKIPIKWEFLSKENLPSLKATYNKEWAQIEKRVK